MSPPDSPKEGVMLLALLFAGAMVAGFTVIAIYRAVAGGDLSAGTAAVVVFLGVAVLFAAREAVKRF
ncbi:hypothetical protein [Halolamina sp.]|uniref:hypothetical protein n=1 Tax=Halolamina sp. TaxID=1940283 RepID=UPI0035695FF4